MILMVSVDLNLMKTFVLLYQTGSVTRTAERLSITQPSVSHALGRLRKQLNDRLFLRSPEGLQPTETARRLYPEIHQALEVIEAAVAGSGTFDPATSNRTFRILATDLGEVALLPAVLAELEKRAPRIGVEITPLDFGTAENDLRQGRADAVICTPRINAEDLRRDALFQEHYVGLCAASHPRIGARPTLEDYLAERHIAVDPASGHTDAEHALARLGHRRDVAVHVSHFAALPRLLDQTRYLAIVPATVADWFARAADVRTFTLPYEVPGVEIALYTYRRVLPAPGTEWLRQVVCEVLRR